MRTFLSSFKAYHIVLVASLTLAACSPGKNIFSDASPQLVAAPDKVSAMLANAADRASTALETLAAVEQGRSPGVAVAPIVDAPPELLRAITVNWIGPVETISKTLADRAGYGFRTIGTAPTVALIVSVDSENKPVIEVLRDIGLQLGQRADIHVNAQDQMVELQFGPNTGPGGF